MKKLEIEHVHGFEGLYVLTPTVFFDIRGSFSEIFHSETLEKEAFLFRVMQENQICSRRGALRGMHFQRTSPQAKLIRVSRGRMFDAVVDLRPKSESFGKWFGIELSEENGRQLLIPRGFAHGCLTLSDFSVCSYLCDAPYAPDDEGGFPWNDHAVGIVWPELGDGNALADGTPLLLSEKDKSWAPFSFLG